MLPILFTVFFSMMVIMALATTLMTTPLLDRILPRLADFSIALTPELEGFLRAGRTPSARDASWNRSVPRRG